MTLQRMVRLLSLLLVLIASLPVYFSDELPFAIWPLLGLGLVTAWFTADKAWSKTTNNLVTGLLIAGFVVGIAWAVQTGEWLVTSVVFGLLATIIRALQLPTSRQAFQLVALSFLIMVAAAVTNPDLSFAIYFLFYTVVFTWALTYVHLLQRVEEGEESSGLAWQARRLVSRRFLLGSSALALALLLSSMLIFMLFPRLGLGFFSAQTRKGNPITGFSDSLELGHFGTLQDSARVVMRIEFPGDKSEHPSMTGFKMRGLSFDTYDGHAWSRTPAKAVHLRSGKDGFYEVSHSPHRPRREADLVEYDVYLEPLGLDARVLFTGERPLEVRHLATRFDRFRGTGKKFFQDRFGNLSFTGPAMTSTSYTVRSGPLKIAPARLRRTEVEYPEEIAQRYTQLPEDLDSRIPGLAVEAAEAADNPYDSARNIENWLQANYGYTTTGEGLPEDPVADFLFERKEGHCEYFATTMVILLRTMGIPARPVNGFLGASYNEFGDYYTVTDGRAHSWVEVYFQDYGWFTFDPTPAMETIPQSQGFLAMMELWLDAIKLRWYKWVVEYDLEKQLAVYSRVWNLFASKQNQVELSPNLSISQMKREMKKIGSGLSSRWTVTFFLCLIGLLLVAAAFRRWWLRRDHRQRSRLDKLAARVRHVLKGKGLPVTPGTTLPHLSRTALARNFAGSAHLAELVMLLEEARWRPGADFDLVHLRRLLAEVQRAPRLPRPR